jgi:hypothetical protein
LAESHTVWGPRRRHPALADPIRRCAALRRKRSARSVRRQSRPDPWRLAARRARRDHCIGLAGPQGVAVVRQLAEDHPDTRLRAFARLALGHGPKAH